ncbi:hypothetical protein [Streptomyces sp. NBC_01244]|uniref:hypothetical protein n=1 Tax=Streptomyces sp. NBC_01244 TaxID=2903797 RepID=UPI002E12F1F1|nr:hypothetical protein OG247_19270 [Streptomyces sp. NBC_01244]
MNDFDFLVGTWDVSNRWLADFLDGGSGWEEFPAVSRATRHFDGAASFDEIEFPTKGFAGLTLRLYEPERERWTLNWSSRRTGTLFPPVTGRFDPATGTGVFQGEDTYGGKDVLVRFVWSRTDTDSPRWEQFFSADGGESWIHNWAMDFSRRAAGTAA